MGRHLILRRSQNRLINLAFLGFFCALLSGLLFGVAASEARAAGYGGSSGDDTFYLDLHLVGAYAQVAHPSIVSSPTLGEGSGGLTLGWYFYSPLFICISGDYGNMSQLSSVDDQIGNFRGTRGPGASAGLGINLSGYILKAEYVGLSTYNLTNANSSGQSISYSGASGVRGALLFPFFTSLDMGLFYESTSYSQQSLSGTSATLSSPLVLTEYGLIMAVVF